MGGKMMKMKKRTNPIYPLLVCAERDDCCDGVKRRVSERRHDEDCRTRVALVPTHAGVQQCQCVINVVISIIINIISIIINIIISIINISIISVINSSSSNINISNISSNISSSTIISICICGMWYVVFIVYLFLMMILIDYDKMKYKIILLYC